MCTCAAYVGAQVEVSHVEEAVRLWYTAMQSSASRPDGTIDMDNIITGAFLINRVRALFVYTILGLGESPQASPSDTTVVPFLQCLLGRAELWMQDEGSGAVDASGGARPRHPD